MMGKPFFIVCLLAISTSVLGQSNSEKLIEMMNGSFTSQEQATADESYYSINLHMYRIWEEFDEIYFYVEQAADDTPDKPYRQRVYMMEEVGDGQFKSTIYTIHHADHFIGKWNDLKIFESFDNSILSEKQGCDVMLTLEGDTFKGSTSGTDCKSEMRGASYATSEITISKDQLTSWDRGFDAEGNQVWGPEKGAYIFKRK